MARGRGEEGVVNAGGLGLCRLSKGQRAESGLRPGCGLGGGLLWPCGKNGEKKTGGHEREEGATGLARDVGWTNRRRAKQTGSLAQMVAEGWWCVRVPVAKHFHPLFPLGPEAKPRSQAMSPLLQKGHHLQVRLSLWHRQSIVSLLIVWLSRWIPPAVERGSIRRNNERP